MQLTEKLPDLIDPGSQPLGSLLLSCLFLKDSNEWYEWAINLESLAERPDKDTFFMNPGRQSIIRLNNLESFFDICPIAANRPMELAIGKWSILSGSHFAGAFAPSGDGAFYRIQPPIYTVYYNQATEQFFDRLVFLAWKSPVIFSFKLVLPCAS